MMPPDVIVLQACAALAFVFCVISGMTGAWWPLIAAISLMVIGITAVVLAGWRAR